jgi:hypothetical protein
MRFQIRGGGLLVLALSAWPLACATPTHVQGEYSDPSRAASPIHDVVVFAIDVPNDQRHQVEDQVVADLNEHGIRANASYAVIGESLPDVETSKAMSYDAGYDGALVLRLRRVVDKPTYAGSDHLGPGPWGSTLADPGKYVNERTVSVDSSLWDLRDSRKIWAASTETQNPSSTKDAASSISNKIVPKIVEKGFINKTNQ